MKITADRKALADAIAWVAHVVPRNPNTPALGGIVLRAADGHLALSAFDYDASRTVRMPVEVHDDGECLVLAGFLRSIVGALATPEVGLTLDGAELTLSAGRSTYTARTLALGEYPSLPAAATAMGTVDAALLADAVGACIGSVDDEAPTESFRGLRIEGTARGLDLVGLDGRMLIHRTIDWDGEHFATTTPGKPVASAVTGLRGTVTLGVDERAISLADDDRTVVLRTMSHQYANWRLVPRPSDQDRFSVVVDRDELAAAVKRASLLGRGSKDPGKVTVTYELDHIEITATEESAGGCEVVDAESDGREVVPVNPDYLLGALSAMDAGPVRIGLGLRRQPRMAGLTTVRPAHDDHNDREATFAAREGGEVR